MEKEFFKDLPDTSTPLNASRLNKLLNGKESMGDITVESIKSKNLLMLSNPLEVTLSKEIVGDFEAGTYTLSVSDIQSSGTSADYLFLFVGYSSEEYYVYLRQDRLSYTFDLPWNAEKLVIYSQHGYADSVDITTTFEDVMLEKGNEATSYSSFKDFVIEAGENENGTWEKWASGKMICRGLISRYVEGGHIEQVSGWYVSERIQVNFPKKKYGTWDFILFVLYINMHLRTNVCEPLFSNLCSYYNTEHSFVNTILIKNRTFV